MMMRRAYIRIRGPVAQSLMLLTLAVGMPIGVEAGFIQICQLKETAADRCSLSAESSASRKASAFPKGHRPGKPDFERVRWKSDPHGNGLNGDRQVGSET
jgi:hypothetical protein